MPPRRYNNAPITLSFPPFTRAISWLIGINVAVYFLFLLLRLSATATPLAIHLLHITELVPADVAHGQIWQIVTYAFVHLEFLHILLNMLWLWMFGAQLEQTWGRRRFLELYFFSLVGAALVTIGMSYGGVLGLNPGVPTIGASGGVYGVLIAFGMVFAEMEIMLFPLPFNIKAKYFAWILVAITLASSLQGPGGVAYMAHLGGLLFGFLYVKFIYQTAGARRYAPGIPGRGLSDRAFNPKTKKQSVFVRGRNSYYRWKRRRAARKFEVYMRKHDRTVFFDEHGNYIDPDSAEARRRGDSDEGKKPWVN